VTFRNRRLLDWSVMKGRPEAVVQTSAAADVRYASLFLHVDGAGLVAMLCPICGAMAAACSDHVVVVITSRSPICGGRNSHIDTSPPQTHCRISRNVSTQFQLGQY
jgi:hypothetical protein